MPFGQQPGPPASSRQMQELLTLLQDEGYADFRAARGPMGFNQRQAGGKFTRDEAAAFVAQLQEAEPAGEPAGEPARAARRISKRLWRGGLSPAAIFSSENRAGAETVARPRPAWL